MASLETNDQKLAAMELDQVYEPAIPFHDPQLSSVPTRRQLLWGYPFPNPVRFSILSAAPIFGMQYGMVTHQEDYARFLNPAHAYFDSLCAMAETILCRSYRVTSEIEGDREGPPPAVPDIAYDPAEDAARVTFFENASSVGAFLSPKFGDVSTGTLLFTWDAKWEADWQAKREELHTQQTFTLAYEGQGKARRASVMSYYSTVSPPDVGTVGGELIFWEAAGESDPPRPEVDIGFTIHPDTWTRYWWLVDFTGDTMTLWVADRSRSPRKVYDALAITRAGNGLDTSTGLNAFRFDYQGRQHRVGPEMYAWFRNLAVLQDVADPQGLVDDGVEIPGP